MTVKATGQFTIIDYNDALTLSGFISSNHPRTQVYNPDNSSFTPSWATQNLVLTPSLFILGSSNDIIQSAQVQSIKWFDAAAPTTQLVDGATYGIPASGLKTLTVKQNVLSNKAGVDFICEVIYRDPTTNLDLTYKMGISFNKVSSGGGIVDAIAWTPDGNVFKNDSVASLKAICELWRGSVVDTTLVTYQWYRKKPGANDDSAIVGTGWEKITAGNAAGITGFTATEMTVPASAVLNIGVFKCAIRDTDPASPTNNQYFQDQVTFVDQSDPLQVSIASTGGDVFKNSVGSTTLTARVFRAGAEIDIPGSAYTYRWYKYDKNGSLVANFGGAGVNFKTGKTLAVGSADVDTKATFVVELT